MLSDEERKAIERIEDFLTTNIILSISSDETANAEELTAVISKNEYLSIEFIASMFLKQSKEIEVLKDTNKKLYEMGKQNAIQELINNDYISKDKIKAKIEEFKIVRDTILENEKEFNRPMMTYDLKRNDYCEKMLQSLLEKE